MPLSNPLEKSKDEHRLAQTKLVVYTLQILWAMYYSLLLTDRDNEGSERSSIP